MTFRPSARAALALLLAACSVRAAEEPAATALALESVPPALLAALGNDRTYVEESCTRTTFPEWPHAAQRCTYRDGLVVTIANPSRERVGRWILDAARTIPALESLRTRDPASWERGLVIVARHTIGQSSRIFPLDGQVWENGTAYRFERGVTKTCSSGCYCRVNSASRQDWCAYAAQVLGSEDEQACLVRYGQTTSTLPEAWLAHCFDVHAAAFEADANPHYRAQAWRASRVLAARFPDPATASGPAVVAALDEVY